MSIRNGKYNKDLSNEEKDTIYDHMHLNNSTKYNILKASEELLELALALTQMMSKPGKINEQEIINEMGDVKIRLEILERIFPTELIDKRINNKLNQFQRFIETGKHKNI